MKSEERARAAMSTEESVVEAVEAGAEAAWLGHEEEAGASDADRVSHALQRSEAEDGHCGEDWGWSRGSAVEESTQTWLAEDKPVAMSSNLSHAGLWQSESINGCHRNVCWLCVVVTVCWCRAV